MDRLLRLRAASRWSWDRPTSAYLTDSMVLAPFVATETTQRFANIGEYWARQLRCLTDSASLSRVTSAVRGLVATTLHNDAVARRTLSILRERGRAINGDETPPPPNRGGTVAKFYDVDRLYIPPASIPTIVTEDSRIDDDAARLVERIESSRGDAAVRSVDVHVLQQFDSERGQVARTGLPADQQALLLSVVLRTGLGSRRDINVSGLRQFSEEAVSGPLRACWKTDVNGLAWSVRGYSLHAHLHVRDEVVVRRDDHQQFFVWSNDWCIARGVVAPQVGTFKALLVPVAREAFAPEEAVGERLRQFLAATFNAQVRVH